MVFKFTNEQRVSIKKREANIHTYNGDEFMKHDTVSNKECPVEERFNRFFIKMGYCGFNSPANNGFGYKTERSAIQAILRYQLKVK